MPSFFIYSYFVCPLPTQYYKATESIYSRYADGNTDCVG
jgi:hypothetical protein